ncbi:MAG: hypothetical protein PHW21_05290 [Candidatus Izemoplasmatales bacterium]|nr:hypothetical protein [Candidatus Izemoplasmatales bacterium]
MNRFDTSLKYLKLKDLLYVILYGGVLSILIGVLIGFIDYYLQTQLPVSFAGILFFLSSMQIGKMVRRQYEFPHIVYIVITGFFMVIQAFIIFFFPTLYLTVLINDMPSLFFSGSLYLYILESFIGSLFLSFNINAWLTLLVFVIGVYLGVKQTY